MAFVKRTFANVAAGQTDSALVSAVSGTAIKVLGVATKCGGTATNITFNSKGSGAGTAISALFANGINGDTILPYNVEGWFETTIGEGLTCTTGAGSTTGIQIIYAIRTV